MLPTNPRQNKSERERERQRERERERERERNNYAINSILYYLKEKKSNRQIKYYFISFSFLDNMINS